MTSDSSPTLTRYPLTWPVGWSRTSESARRKAQFEVSFAIARDHLLLELSRLKATDIIISTNVPVRQDGLLYAKHKQPQDPGVAVYFQYRKKSHVLACDRWSQTKDNLRAIGLHIEATRGIARWGVGSLEQAFTGYQALPQPKSSEPSPWWIVLGVSRSAPIAEIKAAYYRIARSCHPDNGGSHEQMIEINRAWQEAEREKAATI